jgi:hypothetical protein
MKSTRSIEVAFKEIDTGTLMMLRKLSSVSEVQKRGDKFRLITEYPAQTLKQLFLKIDESGLEPVSLNTLDASMEDAFLQLTGEEMKKEVIQKRRQMR